MLKLLFILLLFFVYNWTCIAAEDDNPCISHDWEMVKHDYSLIMVVTPYKSVVLPPNGSVSLIGLSRSCFSTGVDGKCYYECTKCPEKKEETCSLKTEHHISSPIAYAPGTYSSSMSIWCPHAPDDVRSGSANIEVLEKCPECNQSPCRCCKLCRRYPCDCCKVCNRPSWDCYCCSECKKPKDQCTCPCGGCGNPKQECTCGSQDLPPEVPPEPEGPAEDEIEDDGTGGPVHPHNYKADEVRCKISCLNSDVVHYYTGPEDVNQLRLFLISCPIVADNCTVIYRCTKDGCDASRKKYPYHQNKKEDGTPIPGSGLVVEPCPICSENLAEAFTTDGVSTFCMKVKCSCPKNTDYAYVKVKVAIPRIDLDIDSDNNSSWQNWTPEHQEDVIENEAGEPGKILFTNEGCESDDDVPDYANYEMRPGETNLAPMQLKVVSDIPISALRIKLEYPGLDVLPDYTALPDINIEGKTYKNYREQKKGILRVWAGISEPSATRNPATFNVKTNQGNYLPPGIYSAEDLFLPQDTSRTMKLWVEGINPAITQIKVSVSYYENGTWTDFSTFDAVKLTVMEGNLTVNTDNDGNFDLNDNDDIYEDQHDGFPVWLAEDFPVTQTDSLLADSLSKTLSITDQLNGRNEPLKRLKKSVITPLGGGPSVKQMRLTHGYENLFPAKVDVATPPKGNYCLAFIGADGVVCANPYENDRMAYLKKNLATSDSDYTTHPLHSELQMPRNSCFVTNNKEYLFAVNDIDDTRYKVVRLALVWTPVMDSLSDQLVVVDTCKLTPKALEKFFWFGSSIGATEERGPYPVDGNNGVPMDVYPSITMNDAFSTAPYKADKDYIIFLHGFNVDTESAINASATLFRRLYWTGFRGNYIGINWEGTWVSEGVSAIAFNECVKRAFRSADSLRRFVLSLPGGAEQKNLMAHSLGNLVVWEALRLHAAMNSDNPTHLVKRVYSVQAAVFEDAFDKYGEWKHDEAGESPITYNPDSLIKHSWSFWFNQPSYRAVKSVEKFYCSFLKDDLALDVQKMWLNLTDDPYFREKNQNRTPYSLASTAPLIKHGCRNLLYSYQDLRSPIGMGEITSVDGVSFHLIDSRTLNWRPTEHTDFLNREYYWIFNWYQIMFVKDSDLIKVKVR